MFLLLGFFCRSSDDISIFITTFELVSQYQKEYLKFVLHQSINQSINQPTNQSINQSINQSTNRTINQSTNHSIDQSINQSINQPLDVIFESSVFPFFQALYLAGNVRISSVDILEPLKSLPSLKSLDLVSCNITRVDNYRQKILDLLPKLEVLDGKVGQFF